MATKKCCNCDKARFQNDIFGGVEFVCKYKKDKTVSYSGKCVYGLDQEKNYLRSKR